MKIVVDAMGGDNAPLEIVKGCIEANREYTTDIVLCGKSEEILKACNSLGINELPHGIEIANASEVIDMEDDPAMAFRRKPDSSITVGLNMLKNGQADAFVSAGSTGALLSAATLIVKRIKGVRRACLAPVLPSKSGNVMIIDCGANVVCTAEYLEQFAILGSTYVKYALNIDSPRVGLLNNGTEETKGTDLQIEAYGLLAQLNEKGIINFIGNVEAREVMLGGCDIVVCDGFSGNILLKSTEGTAMFILSELKQILKKNFITKIAALLLKKNLYSMKDKLDTNKIGGTMLLGISKPVIKAHGSSNAEAIKNSIRQAITAVESKTVENAAKWIAGQQ